MSNISANMDAIRTLGTNVQGYASEYIGEVNKIYGYVEELKNGWQGADNQSYVQKVNEYKETITNLGKVIEDYGNFLVDTANHMQSVQDEISAAAGRL